MVKILVADSDPRSASEFEKIGFFVSFVRSGKECLKALGEKKFDVLFLSTNLKDMSAWQIFRKCKGKIRVIMIGDFEISEERKKAIKLSGVEDYLAKPLSFRKLKLLIQKN